MKKKLFGILAVAIVSIPLLSTLPLANAREIFPIPEYRDPSLLLNEVCVLPPTNLKVGYSVDWKDTGGTGLYYSDTYLTTQEIIMTIVRMGILFEYNEIGPILQVFESNKCPAGMEISIAAFPPESCKVGASPLIGNGPSPIFPQYVDGVVHTCTSIVTPSTNPPELLSPIEPIPMP